MNAMRKMRVIREMRTMTVISKIILGLGFSWAMVMGDSLSTALTGPWGEQAEKLPAQAFQMQVVYVNVAEGLIANKKVSADHLDYVQAAKAYYSGDYKRSTQLYDNLKQRNPQIYGYVIMRMAHGLNRLGQYDEARKLLLGWQSLSSNKAQWTDVDEILLEGLLLDSSRSAGELLDSLNFRLASNPASAYKNFLLLRKAEILQRLSQFDAAQTVYLNILVEDDKSWSDSAYKALQDLGNKARPTNDFAQLLALGSKHCSKGAFTQCTTILPPLLQRQPSSKSKKTILTHLANAYYNRKQYTEASKYYQLLIDEYPRQQYWVYNLSRSYRLSGQAEKGREWKNKFESWYPKSDKTAGNYWVKGFEQEQAGEYTQAIATYRHLDTTFPNAYRRQWAGFRIGFVYYKQKQYAKAVAEFLAVSKSGLLWPANGTMYFLGNCYKALGNDSLARHWYLETIADFPVSYYAHRARQKLAHHSLMPKAQIPQLGSLDLSPDSVLSWIKDHAGSYVVQQQYSRQTLQEVEFLLAAGFYPEAEKLFFKISGPYKKDLRFLYEYGELFYKYGMLTRSHRLARSFNSYISRKHLHTAPKAVMKWLYPAPYKDKIQKHINSQYTDAYFIYSVMRQESIFDSDIVSPVGARGLMQIMEYTGKPLAEQEKIQDFNTDMLFNPYMAIRLGVRYINDLFAEYQNPYWVLANYNAGPKPARRWQKASQGVEWDIAAEEVSFWETRDYLKKVMGNYWTYQSIYEFNPVVSGTKQDASHANPGAVVANSAKDSVSVPPTDSVPFVIDTALKKDSGQPLLENPAQ
jgi:soluble lytic murein transglycosylase